MFNVKSSKLSANRIHMAKQQLGSSPCGNCFVRSNHKGCRPRLDNTLCTCACERATQMREAVQAMQAKTGNVLSIEECVVLLAPKMRSARLGDVTIAPVQRTVTA